MDFTQKIKAAVELYAHRMVSSTMQYSEEVRQDSSLKGKTKALITLDRLQKNAIEMLQYDKGVYKKEQEEKLKSEKLQKIPKSVWFSGKNTEKSFF
ncbi:hypothetical protein WFK_00095 [Escherichia phage vB_EcoM_WFK]|nr:hypothetical protein WFL6982_00095 [Escherichia phage vB_EcoM_WFL6982]QBQ77120.1 hypothetical protein WFK_00095 [Escherichia phage vB_EcoM_WFK]